LVVLQRINYFLCLYVEAEHIAPRQHTVDVITSHHRYQRSRHCTASPWPLEYNVVGGREISVNECN